MAEKGWHDFNRGVEKISPLTSGEIDKYKYAIGKKKILLGKAFEKQIKTMKIKGKTSPNLTTFKCSYLTIKINQ